jgi:stage II sporulation protein D
MKRCGLALLIVVSSACGATTTIAPGTRTPPLPLPAAIRVQVTEGGTTAVREVALEAYVRATAISEFAPAAGDLDAVERMLEVQAIISRTYAVSHLGRHARDGFDLCATTHCQLFEPRRLQTSRWAEASATAVARTAGQILIFARQPVQALFHADCGGHTSTSAAVWGGINRPYLIARPDDGVPSTSHAEWRYETSLDALGAALASDPRTQVGGALDGIDIVARDQAGRAERVALRAREDRGPANPISIEVKGDELRQVLARAFGARAIRSTRFDVRRAGSTVTFTGTGFGHGVGLCQAGAYARLKAGTSPADVLRHYYPGVVLTASSQPPAANSQRPTAN